MEKRNMLWKKTRTKDIPYTPVMDAN